MLQDFYKDNIKRIKNISVLSVENNKEIQHELVTANAISFAALIRSGYEFNIEHPEEDTTKKKSNLTDLIFEDVSDNTEPDNICIVIDKEVYRCLSTDLKSVMHDDYDKYVLGLITSNTGSDNNASVDTDKYVFDLDDMDNIEPDDVLKADDEKPKEEKQEEITNTYHKPVFGYDRNFRDDEFGIKTDDSFLCDEYLYDKMHVFIYPLRKESDSLITDIMVVAEMNGSVRANLSKGHTLSVTIDFGNISFLAKGSWQNGEFRSQINFTNASVNDVVPVKHRPLNERSTTYVRVPMDGAALYMFPCQFNDNNDKGLCTTAIVLAFDDELSVLSPNPDGNFVLTGEGGDTRTIEAYWQGNEYRYDIY